VSALQILLLFNCQETLAHMAALREVALGDLRIVVPFLIMLSNAAGQFPDYLSAS
jgi:hypothetical protein